MWLSTGSLIFTETSPTLVLSSAMVLGILLYGVMAIASIIGLNFSIPFTLRILLASGE